MKKTTIVKGRRPEMNVVMGRPTIERWENHYAENDYAEIAKMVNNPPTTAVTIGKHINAAAKKPTHVMPLSIAKALQKYYLLKEKEQNSVLE